MKLCQLCVVSFCLVLAHAIPPEVLNKFCSIKESDPNHFNYIKSDCQFPCTEFAVKHDSGLVCSPELKDWCDGGECRHYDQWYNISFAGLTYTDLGHALKPSGMGYESCRVPANFSLSDTPLLDRSQCSQCVHQLEAMAHNSNYMQIECPAFYRMDNSSAVLLEMYGTKLDQHRDVMTSAELYPFPETGPEHLIHKQFTRFVTKSLVKHDEHQQTVLDIQIAFYYYFK